MGARKGAAPSRVAFRAASRVLFGLHHGYVDIGVLGEADLGATRRISANGLHTQTVGQDVRDGEPG